MELGGSSRDPKGFWPELYSGDKSSYSSDSAENALKKAGCDGRTALAAAQHAMRTGWTTAESVLG